ncbi:SKS1 [Candida oxycetoniae]|uniref:SKS1 n=1 Tax=Candida oxycetoniae TaxID=497107 RepID=A0AAI9WYD4_9ASCO|nr:SKS1 [Candida oxycetoniae]KAI3404924.1 SKS1 [Candida oxycetoniae]
MTLDILPIFELSQPTTTVGGGSPPQQYISTSQSLPTSPQLKRQKPNVNMMLDGYMLNKDLRFVKKIGAGTYGLIYLVENIYTKKQYAAKMLLKQPPKTVDKDSNVNKQLIQQHFYNYFLNHVIPRPESINFEYIKSQGHECPFLTEIALHLKVHEHPNVITIHEVFNLENFAVVILMDYFEQGDLFGNIIDRQVFQKHKHDKQMLMKNAMLQLVDAVEYCCQHSVYHCDLKPENIMVRYNPHYRRPSDSTSILDYNELHLVLIDFGLAISSDIICCNACRGSSFYMAPERTTNFNTNKLIKSLVDMNQFVSVKSALIGESSCKYLPTLAGDIWSLGVLFINITCSRNPWPIASITESHNDVFNNYILNQNKTILSSILPISQQFNNLLNKIFQLNPNNRIDLNKLYKEIIRCDFFKDDHYDYGTHYRKPIMTNTTINTNQQLYTPPESTAYNSYASEIEVDDEEEEEEEEEEEYYTEEEEEEEEEEELAVVESKRKVNATTGAECNSKRDNILQPFMAPNEPPSHPLFHDVAAFAKKICPKPLTKFASQPTIY